MRNSSQSYSSDMWFITEELHILFCSVWTGCVIRGVYVGIQIVRMIIKHRNWMISFEDFCFWIFTSFYTFHQVFLASYGNLRWYIFVGLAVGVWAVHIIWNSTKKIGGIIKKKLVKEA